MIVAEICFGSERARAMAAYVRPCANLSDRTRAAALLEVKTNSFDHCTVVIAPDFTSINWCSALTAFPMVFGKLQSWISHPSESDGCEIDFRLV